jgi:CRP/FNR family transcriptional regulator
MGHDTHNGWLAHFPALQAIQDPAWITVLGEAHEITVPPETFVFRDGAPCQNYLLVLEGSVRVQKVAESGREIVLYRVEDGQSCILTTSCLLANEHYVAEAIAETEVKAVTIPFARFLEALGGSPGFREFVFASYGQRIADLVTLIDAIAFGRMDCRLARCLLERADAQGEASATHQELARELGTAREVVSRLLKDFESHGWVALHRGRIEIRNPDILDRLAKKTAE